jgi:hypothetical protein
MADSLNLTSLVEFLLSEQVSFVLVGGLAAVAQGAPLTTQDVDIVHARTPENLDRLMVALGKLDARYRGDTAIAADPGLGRTIVERRHEADVHRWHGFQSLDRGLSPWAQGA